MSRLLVCLLLSLSLSWSSAAWAKGKVVVVADVAGDETANAQLRAQLYETARQRGYQPDPKADVTGAAAGAGAMEAGSVVTDASRLEAVRKALSADALVRVARDDGGIAVIVVTARGSDRRTVPDRAAVAGAMAELLGGEAQAPPASASSAAPPAAGYIVKRGDDEGPPPDSPEAVRAAWEARGGVRASYGIRAAVTGLAIPDTLYADQNPVTGELEISRKTTYGVGGGIGAHVSVMYLPLPQPSEDGKNWAAFRGGVGLDLNVLYVRPPQGFNYRVRAGQVESRDTQYDDKAIAYALIPFQLGVHFGFGKFRSPSLWRGVTLGVAYSPTLITSLEIGKKQDDAQTDFNYAGFELSLDITKLESGESANSQIRLFALVLPRINDELPWLTSAGIGAVWY